jgi:hypothetical protein
MELFFPYTFVTASGLLPAQFNYTGTMMRTVGSYFFSIPDRRNTTQQDPVLILRPATKSQWGQILTLLAIPNP